MAYKFFYIPVQSPADAEAELNAFLARHGVQTVDRQFISAGEHSAWSLCVAYETARESVGQSNSNRRKGSVDYREVLDAPDFDVFAELRRLRKRLAEEQAVPPYTVFTNEQLASMVTGRAQTLADLRAIDGIGESRCERYGKLFLDMLRSLQGGAGDANNDGTQGDPGRAG